MGQPLGAQMSMLPVTGREKVSCWGGGWLSGVMVQPCLPSSSLLVLAVSSVGMLHSIFIRGGGSLSGPTKHPLSICLQKDTVEVQGGEDR